MSDIEEFDPDEDFEAVECSVKSLQDQQCFSKSKIRRIILNNNVPVRRTFKQQKFYDLEDFKFLTQTSETSKTSAITPCSEKDYKDYIPHLEQKVNDIEENFRVFKKQLAGVVRGLVQRIEELEGSLK